MKWIHLRFTAELTEASESGWHWNVSSRSNFNEGSHGPNVCRLPVSSGDLLLYWLYALVEQTFIILFPSLEILSSVFFTYNKYYNICSEICNHRYYLWCCFEVVLCGAAVHVLWYSLKWYHSKVICTGVFLNRNKIKMVVWAPKEGCDGCEAPPDGVTASAQRSTGFHVRCSWRFLTFLHHLSPQTDQKRRADTVTCRRPSANVFIFWLLIPADHLKG